MKVIIIGAGQSGLVTCKTFVENGFDTVVLEKGDTNGLFNNVKDKEKYKWSSSRIVSGFSDYPIPKKYPMWLNFKQYTEFINSYKKKFNLDKHIRYNCEVVKADKINGKWEVIYIENYLSKKIYCDRLIICAGLNSIPKIPDLNLYKGEVIHTDEIYRNMNETELMNKFRNKRVLLIGGGESSLDIGHNILKYTKELYFTTKRYVEWYPEWSLDKIYYKKHGKCWNHMLLDMDDSLPSDAHLSPLEYSLPTPASGFWHNFGRKLLGQKIFFKKKKVDCIHNHEKLCEITDTPSNLFGKYVVKRTPFICDLHEKKVKVIYYPDEFNYYSVKGKDGIINNIDIILVGTGYKMEIPFLKDKYYKGEYIKKMVPIKDKTLAFVGYARPTMGSLNNISEMQSWWLSDFFKGKLNYKNRNLKWMRPSDPLNISKNVVIGIYYMKDLAMDMGLYPINFFMFKTLFNDPELFFRIIHSTVTPMLFRLTGKLKQENARKMYMDNFPNFEQKNKNNMTRYYIFFTVLHIIYLFFLYAISYIIHYIISKKKIINEKWKWLFFIGLVFISYEFFY